MLGVLLYLPSSFLPGPCLTCYRSPKFWDHLDLNEHVSLPSCLFWQVTLDSMLSLSGFPPLAGVAMCLAWVLPVAAVGSADVVFLGDQRSGDSTRSNDAHLGLGLAHTLWGLELEDPSTRAHSSLLVDHCGTVIWEASHGEGLFVVDSFGLLGALGNLLAHLKGSFEFPGAIVDDMLHLRPPRCACLDSTGPGSDMGWSGEVPVAIESIDRPALAMITMSDFLEALNFASFLAALGNDSETSWCGGTPANHPLIGQGLGGDLDLTLGLDIAASPTSSPEAESEGHVTTDAPSKILTLTYIVGGKEQEVPIPFLHPVFLDTWQAVGTGERISQVWGSNPGPSVQKKESYPLRHGADVRGKDAIFGAFISGYYDLYMNDSKLLCPESSEILTKLLKDFYGDYCDLYLSDTKLQEPVSLDVLTELLKGLGVDLYGLYLKDAKLPNLVSGELLSELLKESRVDYFDSYVNDTKLLDHVALQLPIELPTDFSVDYYHLDLLLPGLLFLGMLMWACRSLNSSWASSRCSSTVGAYWIIMLSMLPSVVGVTCRICKDTLDPAAHTQANCPLVTTITANVTALAAGAGATISVLALLPLSLRSSFTPSILRRIMEIYRCTDPYSPFQIEADTGVREIMQAISAGRIAKAEALEALAGRIAADGTNMQDVAAMIKMVGETSEPQGSVGEATETMDVLTYVLMIIVRHVEGTSAASLGSTITPASASPKVSRRRPKSEVAFYRSLNLLTLVSHVAGAENAVTLNHFIDEVVFHSVMDKGMDWRVAFELLLVYLDDIHRNPGANVSSVLRAGGEDHRVDRAHREAARIYGAAAFFRPRAGTGAGGVAITTNINGGVTQWNNKFQPASSKVRACPVFNGVDPAAGHTRDVLKSDGTCKFKHVCNHWVSDAGPYGRCGSAKHGRAACDHPRKCDEPIKK